MFCSQAGIATLFNALYIYTVNYHSMGIHLRPFCKVRILHRTSKLHKPPPQATQWISCGERKDYDEERDSSLYQNLCCNVTMQYCQSILYCIAMDWTLLS